MKNTIRECFTFCRKYLQTYKIDLSEYSVLLSAKDYAEVVYQYHGNSAGTVIAMCILSELLQKPIPPDVAMTGAMTAHGEIYGVGAVRERRGGQEQCR